ncbi:DNA/RNA non-specific endonuclease [Streptomyces sp. NPDC050523]|uniref:DNA/RNA non-specific endonuclease n=1 Tax=Streptomyces sp. NPDC050523 TaxID=3365622 RepID=UPI00379110AD
MRNRKSSRRVMAVTVTTAALAAVSTAGSLAHADSPASSGARSAQAVPCAKHLEADHTYHSQKPKQNLSWTYKTDAEGRPVSARTSQAGSAYSHLTPNPLGKCDALVGQWGGPGHTGARLILSHLGGESQRPNLVPVTASAGAILVKAMNNAAKSCANTPDYLLKYAATAHYKDNKGITPSRIDMRLDLLGPVGSPAAQGATVDLNFANKTYTKASATKLTSKLAKDLKAAGCTMAG